MDQDDILNKIASEMEQEKEAETALQKIAMPTDGSTHFCKSFLDVLALLEKQIAE